MISIWLCPDYNDELYLRDVINHLSNIYDCPKFTPHCTLLSSLKTKKHELENIIEICIENIKPIIVESNGIGFSNIFWKTVFIELIDTEVLKELQQSISKKIDLNVGYKFEPHLSLIYKIIPENIKKEIINSLFLKNSFKMNKIAIVKTGQNVSDWEKIVERKFYA